MTWWVYGGQSLPVPDSTEDFIAGGWVGCADCECVFIALPLPESACGFNVHISYAALNLASLEKLLNSAGNWSHFLPSASPTDCARSSPIQGPEEVVAPTPRQCFGAMSGDVETAQRVPAESILRAGGNISPPRCIRLVSVSTHSERLKHYVRVRIYRALLFLSLLFMHLRSDALRTCFFMQVAYPCETSHAKVGGVRLAPSVALFE